jgi:hypothetical protein
MGQKITIKKKSYWRKATEKVTGGISAIVQKAKNLIK